MKKRVNWQEVWKAFDEKMNKKEAEVGYLEWPLQKKIIERLVEKQLESR